MAGGVCVTSRTRKRRKIGAPEHFEELQVGVADVLDIMPIAALYVAYVSGVKVHSDGSWPGVENGHASLTLDPVLPFIGIRMPMHLPESSGCRVTRAAAIVLETMKLLLSAIRTRRPLSAGWRTGAEGEGEGMWKEDPLFFHGRLVCGEGAREFALEDVKLVERDLREYLGRHPKFSASMSGGVCANQSVTKSVLYSVALPSSKHRMNSHPSGPSPCSECGRPAGKYQRSPSFTSATEARPISSRIVTRQFSIRHEAPFGCQVPVHLPYAPAVSRMSTPEMVSEIAKSACVT